MADEFCGACGRQGRPDDRFCRGCGAALGGDEAARGAVAEAERFAARGEFTDALAAVQRAISIDDAAELRVALATLHARRGALDEAEPQLAAALVLDPACAVAHAYAGAVHLRRGRVGDAEDALDRARDLAPDNLIVRLKRAEYFAALGVLERARDELRHGLARGDGGSEARHAAVKLLADLDRRLGRSVQRHPARLPHIAGLGRLIHRRRAGGPTLTSEGEA